MISILYCIYLYTNGAVNRSIAKTQAIAIPAITKVDNLSKSKEINKERKNIFIKSK